MTDVNKSARCIDSCVSAVSMLITKRSFPKRAKAFPILIVIEDFYLHIRRGPDR